MIFDIDDGHKLVRRIEVPGFAEGIRGFAVNLKTHRAFYGTQNRRIGCIDLETDKVVWEKLLEAGADRSAVTLDGTKLYVPTGWWYAGPDSGFLILNPENGDVIKRVIDTPLAHNAVISFDGKLMYLGAETSLSIYDVATDKLIRHIPNVGEKGMFPYTIDSKQKICYICLGSHVGFDIVELQTGKVLGRVMARDAPIAHRTHGVALTPDETELWVSDQVGKQIFIYDATVMPPKPKGKIENLSQGGHGWITFSLDGNIAWTHTPDVFDVKTRKQIATLKDEKGQPVSGSKFFEAHFRDGKLVQVGNEFGLGRKDLSPAM